MTTAPKQIKAKCARCSGTGRVPLRTKRLDDRCFCCGGKGIIMRNAPTKRLTEGEKIKLFNERVAGGLNPNTGEPLGA